MYRYFVHIYNDCSFSRTVLHRLKAVFLYHWRFVTLRANKHGPIVVQGIISQGPKSSPKFPEVIFMEGNITITIITPFFFMTYKRKRSNADKMIVFSS
jgi:hypothetical protein